MAEKKPVKSDRLIGAGEAAKIAGVTTRTIQRWLQAGLIQGEPVVFGGRTYTRVSVLSLEKHLASVKSKKADQPKKG